jgi:histone-lysine N-methyltransferase SETD3
LWAPMPSDAPDYERKRTLLAAHHLAEHADRTPFELSLQSLNEDLLAYLRIQRMTISDLAEAETVMHSSSSSPLFAYRPISDENEKLVLTALLYALNELMEAFPTSIEEDEATLQDMKMDKQHMDVLSSSSSSSSSSSDPQTKTARMYMVLVLRHSEKKILTQHIVWLQEKLLPVLAAVRNHEDTSHI